MRIAFDCGWNEDYWHPWPWRKAYGGSEHIVVELAAEFATWGHEVVVRLPRELPEERSWRGIRWIGTSQSAIQADRLFLFDAYNPQDVAPANLFVVCRDRCLENMGHRRAYLSRFHASYNGEPGALVLGGGVAMGDYAEEAPRVPQLVIYTSSPDRGGWHAGKIGGEFTFVATYRGANELSREDLVRLQRTASALIHPCDPIRPSEFFGMAVLEAMAAGTPCLISDADALPELWGNYAIVLPRPISYSSWYTSLERLFTDRQLWGQQSRAGRELAKGYSWPLVARRYLAAVEA